MMIPKGISNGQSIRIGIILGNYTIGKFGYELGYFPDFSAMPISEIFSFKSYQPEDDYSNYPQSIYGLPSEFSKTTGLSFRINIPLNEKKVRLRKK